MNFTLPTVSAPTPLAKLLNNWIEHELQPIADLLAPRLSWRQHSFAAETPAYVSAAELFYYAQVSTAALLALHAAYVGALEVVEPLETVYGGSVERYEAERGRLREKLAPFFSQHDSLDERIGSARADYLHNRAEVREFSKQRARAAGLSPWRANRVMNSLPVGVEDKMRYLLTHGQQLVESFNIDDFAGVLRGLRWGITQKK